MKEFVKSHPLITFFVLAYAIAWGLILLIDYWTGFGAFRGEIGLNEGVSSSLLLVWLSMLAGPSIAGIVMTSILDGKEGLRRLFSSMFRWKVSLWWYAAALLIFPVLVAVIIYSFAGHSENYAPGLMIATGIAGGLIGGFFEEIGWTGFALPKFQVKRTPLYTALMLGFIHTLWHLFPDYLGSISFYREFYFIHFLLWIIALIAFRIIAVWIYDRSGSMLLAGLAHGSFTGSQIVFGPPEVTAAQSVLWYGVFAFLLSLIAVMIMIADQRLFFRKLGRRRNRNVAVLPEIG